MQTNKLDSLLEIVKGYTHLSAQDVLTDFMESGYFKHLGEGYFSNVYCHKDYPEYAIKVCLRTADSWPFFAKYCIDNADNEEVNFILPKIHAFHKLSTRGLYIAVTDRLYSVSTYNSIEPERVTEGGLNALRAIASGFDTAFREIGTKVDPDYTRYEAAASLIFSDLSPFCTIDLHGGNVMQDKDNNIIVTDPVSFSPRASSESKINELVCLVKGVEYTGEQAVPRIVHQQREQMCMQDRHAKEIQKRDMSRDLSLLKKLHHWTKNVSVQVIGANLMNFDFAELERKIIGRDFKWQIPNGLMINAEAGAIRGAKGATVKMVLLDDILKSTVQVMQEGMQANRGILKRNPFLAKQLGHHV